jgi:hypothetical protein
MSYTNLSGQVRVGVRPAVTAEQLQTATYLLDSYSGVAAAYSLRKLNSTYVGPAIRVRRSGDNVEQNIGFDAGGNLDTASLLSFVGVNNQALYSEEFDNNSYWHKNDSSIVANQTTAPDGTMTADLFREGTSQWNHSLGKLGPTSYLSGTSYNASVYLKKGPGTQAPNTIALGFSETNTSTMPYVIFNISTGVVVTSGNATGDSNFGYSIEDAGDGWWRCSIWGTITGTLSRTQLVYVRFVNNLNTLPSPTAYVGNINRDIYIWGYQYVNSVNDTSALTLKEYRKTSAVSSGSGFVTTWYDQSGNGRNATQSTAASQPKITVNGILNTLGDKPAINFDGSGDSLNSPYNQGSTNEMYLVTQTSDTYFVYPTNGLGTYGYVAQNGSTSTSLYSGYGTPQLFTNGVLKTPVNRTDVYNILNGYKLVNHKNFSMSGWSPYPMILGVYSGSADYNGNVHEWLIYPTLQGSQSQIESNINSYYSLWDSSIVQSGLVMNLDAGFKSSYLGSGTTWYDISGSGNNNGTLTNGVGYSSVNGGVMTFDGVNDYINIPSTSALNLGIGNWTFDVWFFIPQVYSSNNLYTTIFDSNGLMIGTLRSGLTGLSGFYTSNGSNQMFISSRFSNYTYGGFDYNCAGKWTNLSIVKNGSTTYCYLNGSLYASMNSFTYTNQSNSGRYGLGLTNAEPLNGNISSSKIYNRALSDSEILQNFNALKSRFGL